jgi:hypothetical protein
MTISNLKVITVYDRPTDYPDHFVARQFNVSRKGIEAGDIVALDTDLSTVRHQMTEMGLSMIPRNEQDDEKVVETWL